ncbi:hypothetical protein [Exiguobacterium sp. s143]|uniref:hypothetical protein n=1 Tax=Exiguobacterium sp. s143 TaxID=2751201 RepID=UPI001BE717D3|nr:hypothetical protein [Exiguobacterium sp. s143]
MKTLEKYKPTGSNEVDKLLKVAHQTIQRSNNLQNEIHGEVNQKNIQQRKQHQNLVRLIMNRIFK